VEGGVDEKAGAVEERNEKVALIKLLFRN